MYTYIHIVFSHSPYMYHMYFDIYTHAHAYGGSSSNLISSFASAERAGSDDSGVSRPQKHAERGLV